MPVAPVQRLPEQIEAVTTETIGWLAGDFHEVLFAIAIGSGLFLAFRALRWALVRALGEQAEVTTWRGFARRVIGRTRSLFIAVLAAWLVTHLVAPPGAVRQAIDFAFIVGAAMQGAIWLRAIILSLVERRAGSGSEDQDSLASAMGIITVLVNVVVWLLAIILILDNLGVNVTALIAGLGVGGIAIGLAAQGIFSDLFAALAILFDRPFRVGDTISYGTSTGTVEAIGLKTTRIRALSGEQLVMANTKLLDQQISNLKRIEERRVVLRLAFILATPAEAIEGLSAEVAAMVAAEPDCRFGHAMLVGISSYGLDYEVVFHMTQPDFAVMQTVRQRVILALMRLLAARAIQFAYPAQTAFTAAPDGTLVNPASQ